MGQERDTVQIELAQNNGYADRSPRHFEIKSESKVAHVRYGYAMTRTEK